MKFLCALFGAGYLLVTALTAQLLVDFNSTNQDGGPHNQSGYQAYNAGHEIAADFVAARSYNAFGNTISLSVDFPDTVNPRVQQMIDRGAGNDANWGGQKLDLLTDWIGVDTRTGNGGNGSAGDTRIVFTLSGLPGGAFNWISYHHDTENVFGSFDVEYSTNGGSSYTTVPGSPFDGTDSTPGGSPASAQTYTGTGNQDPITLPSTLDFDFTAVGGQDVVVRFIPIAGAAVHTQLIAINGFEITSTAPPTAPSDLALSASTIARTANIGTTVGTLTTTDPTPGDTFTYTLASGAGDSDNGEFAISGSNLITDRSLAGFAGGTMLAVRVRTTDAIGDWYEESFLIEVIDDSDGDGLEDLWELTYFPNLTTATGSGNNDGDGLTNAQEQSAGTNPTLADTDSDGLNDDVEINTHGSNPLIADTDGDGIDDGAEVSNSNGFVTDPTLADTDGDGFNDALEIAEGTDPTNGGDFPNTLLALRLNEILARNSTDITDGFNNREDWIEIYNPNAQVVPLGGYYLTDNSTNLTKWNFPAVSIPANGYLVVFASGKDLVDGAGNAHTNFSLSANGEFLAIVRPDGSTIDDSFAPTFPEQFTDISYGPPSTGGPPVFFEVSTPNAVNNTAAYPGVVKDTNFTFDRGFYSAPFSLAITSATPGATIRYTTDGSLPSATTGTVYSGPINITTTSNVRAIATLPGWLSTNVDTHSYIFVDDVVQQPTNPAGWPATWGNHDGLNIPSDYEMDPRVVNNTNGLGAYTVQDALLDIPTVSISMEIDDFISDASGIYANPQNRTEKICSMEYILPDGTPGFQEDCKIETHGNASRRPARMQKHSLRLTFSSDVGKPKLRYPLFPQSEVEEFNKLVLRACFTDSWALVSWGSSRYRPNDSMYMRDVWMKDSMRAMGNASGNGDFVHLYVNGLYFGLHDLTERLEDDWYADHIGGKTDDWEVNADILTPGPLWNSMISLVNGNITDNAVYQQATQVIDIDNYSDYIFLHFYADAEDWPTKNGYAAVNAISGDGRWRFQVWDQEISLDKFSWNRYNSNSGSMIPFQRLRLNDEFLINFADRAAKHLYNGGALTTQSSVDRYNSIASEIDKAIVAESARWGDTQETTSYATIPGTSNDPFADFYPPTVNSPIYFTREQHWLTELDHVTNTHIPIINTDSDSRGIINELRANNLYPSIDPPALAQHGGIVPNGHVLGINASAGNIYYTLDGTDPRDVGGGINAGAGMLAGGSIIDTFVDLEETGWRYLDTGVAQSDSDVVVGNGSYSSSDWKHPDYNDAAWGTGQALLGYGVIGSGANTVNVNTTVGPASSPRNPTTYFRKEFTVTGASSYTEISASIIRDDGAIVYLNGKEIGRSNLTAGPKAYADFASSASPEQDLIALGTIMLSPGDLIEGSNVLAIEVHQTSLNSSDLGIDAELKGTKPNAGASGVTLTQTGTVTARAFNSGEWSACTTAEFIVGIPADASNLVVSEMFYNPLGSSDDTEWIELMNISSTDTIDLTNVSLTGVTYTFAPGTTLAPGQRLVIVKDQAAFAAAYNTAGITIAPGAFSTTGLSNGGEEIAVIDATGTDIQRFSYDDNLPWPEAPDGSGYSLVLIAPGTGPDHTLAANWRPSSAIGGTPGASTTTTFTGNPDLDDDCDGMTAFLEYALGSTAGDTAFSPESMLQVSGQLLDDGSGTLRDYLVVSLRRNLSADDAILELQTSTDAAAWNSAGIELIGATHNADGTDTLTYRSLTPIDGAVRQLLRVQATSR